MTRRQPSRAGALQPSAAVKNNENTSRSAPDGLNNLKLRNRKDRQLRFIGPNASSDQIKMPAWQSRDRRNST
jgi:hypothetical protein